MTTQNKIFIQVLKKIKETDWVGNTIHKDLEPCLTAINLSCRRNNGWYIPKPIRIKGLNGIFLLNEDGGLLCDYRILKDERGYLIETLTMSAFNKFEKMYSELINI